jgi:starch-binding outer membrane protein, SusD/RagB family
MNLLNNIRTQQKLILLSITLLAMMLTGCSKLVEVDPPVTSINSSLVYQNDATAIAAVNNLYVIMSQQGIGSGITSLSLYASLSADDLSVYSGAGDPTLSAYYENSLRAGLSGGPEIWNNIYSSLIYTINSALEGIGPTNKLTEKVKNQLLGELMFMRGFCYFNLVNLYGDVPLVLTTDYKKNSLISRTDKNLVYAQIISDLKEAALLLSGDYLNGTLLNSSEERIAPNKWAAKALLARCYLYTGNWEGAEDESSQVIGNKMLYDTVSLNKVFLVNSMESIWQLQSVSSSVTNTSDAYLFILPVNGPDNLFNKVYLNNFLVNAFENGDGRLQNWIRFVNVEGVKYYYPYKYKINEIGVEVSERTMILRLAEQYLIRSEARARQNKFTDAYTDLNIIRHRAGLTPLPDGNDLELILDQIIHERQTELFTEYGHRWYDLKRLNVANKILSTEKGDSWQDSDQLYPIPLTELLKNPALAGYQNPGY